MYLNVELAVNVAKNALTVPDSAVIDSGTRQMLIVDRKDGTFEPREIRVGARGEDYYQVLEGVKRGEWVVTSANFLLDSESNLKAAVGAMSNHQHGGSVKQDSTPPEGPVNHSGHSSGTAGSVKNANPQVESSRDGSDDNLPVIDEHKGHCFRCGTPSLVEIHKGNVVVDICVNEGCGAVHLDPGELETFLEQRADAKSISKAIFGIFK